MNKFKYQYNILITATDRERYIISEVIKDNFNINVKILLKNSAENYIFTDEIRLNVGDDCWGIKPTELNKLILKRKLKKIKHVR